MWSACDRLLERGCKAMMALMIVGLLLGAVVSLMYVAIGFARE